MQREALKDVGRSVPEPSAAGLMTAGAMPTDQPALPRAAYGCRGCSVDQVQACTLASMPPWVLI